MWGRGKKKGRLLVKEVGRKRGKQNKKERQVKRRKEDYLKGKI